MVITVKVTDGAVTVEFPAEEESLCPPLTTSIPHQAGHDRPGHPVQRREGKYMVIDVFFNTAMTDNPDGQDVNIQQGAAAYITDENIVKAVNPLHPGGREDHPGNQPGGRRLYRHGQL